MISVCTAVHPPAVRYLSELYTTLVRQTHCGWEWVIAADGGARVPSAIAQDPRVRMVDVDCGQAKAKAAACHASRGEVIVRVDADDLLMPRALELAAAASGGFRWSNWALFGDGDWSAKWYSQKFGWRYRDMHYEGHRLYEHLAWPLGPLMVASLYQAPACFLAWTRESYEMAGGFENEPQDSPEHELVCRTYCQLGAEQITHIDACLYLYRQRSDSMSLGVIPRDDAIAMHTAGYLANVELCYRRWCEDNGLYKIRLDDVWGKSPVQTGCVGLMLTAWDDLPWDEVFRVMAPGGAVLVDHSIPVTDERFQRYHRSDKGTHFICLKPPYSDRIVGSL